MIWGVIPIEARWMVVIMTGMALYGTTGGFQPGVAHYAHLGGFVGAAAYLLISDKLSPATKFKSMAAPVKTKKATEQDAQRWSAIPRGSLHPINRDELDRILDKISSSGVASLTVDERAFLDRFVN